jgi:hypothetical protein
MQATTMLTLDKHRLERSEEDNLRIEQRVDAAVDDPTGRVKVYLNGTNCTMLPRSIGRLRGSVRELYCDGNPLLRSLPIEICLLSASLTHLDCSNCALTFIPEEFSRLAQLRVLRASRNALRSFMWDCAGMTCLEELDLSHNQIAYLSPSAAAFCAQVTHHAGSGSAPEAARLASRHFVDLTGNQPSFVSPSTKRSELLQHIPASVAGDCAICGKQVASGRVPHVCAQFVKIGHTARESAALPRPSPLVSLVPVLYPCCGHECAIALDRWAELKALYPR